MIMTVLFYAVGPQQENVTRTTSRTDHCAYVHNSHRLHYLSLTGKSQMKMSLHLAFLLRWYSTLARTGWLWSRERTMRSFLTPPPVNFVYLTNTKAIIHQDAKLWQPYSTIRWKHF